MKKIIILAPLLYLYASCTQKKQQLKTDFIIANGQMPSMAKDKNNSIHLVFGSGDSIMYVSLHNGTTFTKPSLIAVLPKLFSFAMRGPQIAATENGLVVTVCTEAGDIFSYYKEGNIWTKGNKVNDTDTTSKEGLTALSADEKNTFAVWLDVRGNRKNKIYGAKSIDGGKIWSKNILVYTSPDTSVCECCKPSVLVKGNKVYVMFRNWLHGNRDLYIIQSDDGGNTFGQAQKLGNGNWQLDGCPMDGGGIAINDNGEIQTVWRRKAKVYAASPGMSEIELGEGKGCIIETVNNKNIYAWTNSGQVIIRMPTGEKKILGKGSQPVVKAIQNENIICVWESARQIHASIFAL
ncbi:MAG: sialidase family protein [Bacteroidota bacterium]